MSTIIDLLRQQFLAALSKAYPAQTWQLSQVEITPSTQTQFGHYQCNSAMKLAKLVGKAPRMIATDILAHLEKSDMIAKTEIAGPGFVNITLEAAFLAARVGVMLNDARLGIATLGAHRKIVIDFSSPNTAKEMHVGHLRSTIIGDSLARIFEFLGYVVLRLNHIGDWGTAFGMLIAHMHDKAESVLSGKQSATLTDLVAWYRESKKRFDEDEDFKKCAQLEVVALQSGKPAERHAWQIICEISRRAYQEIYDLLDVKIIDRGESFYNPMLPEIVRELEQKGMVEISDGAKCVFPPGFVSRDNTRQPLIIQKSDGGYNYATTDLAALKHRVQVEKADHIAILTDAGQASHFAMMFKVAELAGFYNPDKVRIDHVPFGVVLGPDGKKFRTRSGETERLIDLLTTGIEQAEQILLERYGDSSSLDLKAMAHVLGVNAIKYADLTINRINDYTFSYERMLKFEGNTAAFIMYSYVRTASIKRKAGVNVESLIGKTSIQLNHPSEIDLAITLNQFAETLEQVSCDLMPNHLADYLYRLANAFNAFFRDCRVEGSELQNSRLLLCEATAQTLKTGMGLLGLKALEVM